MRRAMLLGTILIALPVEAVRGGGGEFGGKSSGEWVKILRENKAPNARRVALLALETIGPKGSGVTAGLFDALREDADPEVRREIAILLGRMGPDARGAADALGERLLNDKSELVRQAAATALGGKLAKDKDGDGQVRALAAALKDKHEGTRRAAAEALNNLGERATPAVPQLIELAKITSADRYTRVYALQVIGLWGKEDRNAVPTLIAVLAEKAAPLAVRQAAAEGLGRLGGEETTTALALAEALETGAPELRRVVAVSLGQLGEKSAPAWPAMKKTLDDRKGDSATRFALIRPAASLARQHAEVVTVLAKIAENDEAGENRLAAIRELGELGALAEPALPTLRLIAQGDARAALRDAAQAALKKIKAP